MITLNRREPAEHSATSPTLEREDAGGDDASSRDSEPEETEETASDTDSRRVSGIYLSRWRETDFNNVKDSIKRKRDGLDGPDETKKPRH